MFDPVTTLLLDQLPDIGDLDGSVVRTRLTEAYLQLMILRASDGITSESLGQLREMANGLEIFCLMEYANEQQLSEAGRAAAFVAAQSLEFLSELFDNTEEASYRHVLANPRIFTRLESGLLYLISGYYANARVVARLEGLLSPSPEPLTDLELLRRSVAYSLAQMLSQFLRLEIDSSIDDIVSFENLPIQNSALGPTEISQSIESKLMYRLYQSIRVYLDFLGGQEALNAQNALDIVRSIRQQIEHALSPDNLLRVPSEALLAHHLASLLEMVFGSLLESATAHAINPPPDSDGEYQSAFRLWTDHKVRHGYALLWDSTHEWLRQKEDTKSVHSVISMPTGTGKSWLAELELAERLWNGWGIYLAPTNALVRQVREELRDSLKLLDIQVRSFLTDEHTTLSEENLVSVPPREVVIMTPEKATLALRLHPDVFQSCTVCIFDECHLIGQGKRGAISEQLLARLIEYAPNIHIMLMSAMLANPESLADWLANATGESSNPITIQWKPTRNLRTLAYANSDNAGLSSPSEVELSLYGFAEIAWQTANPELAVNAPTNISEYVERDNRNQWKWQPGVNVVARDIAANLVRTGISSLLFIHTSPYHVWTHARDCGDLHWRIGSEALNIASVINAWLALADAELGQLSPLHDFIRRGVTVHSTALIDEERYASELAYSKRYVGLMVATGTLAQGLNFPTQVVVMAGITSYSGVRDEDILNSLGRSGRAGFYNVGLAIVVPNDPIFRQPRLISSPDIESYTRLLEQEDACVEVESALRHQLDRLIEYADSTEEFSVQIQNSQSADAVELATQFFGTATSPEGLRNSFAAYQASNRDEFLDEVYTSVQRILEGYQLASDYPEWLTETASQAGLSVALMYELLTFIDQPDILDQLQRNSSTFDTCMDLFRQAISSVNPFIIQSAFGPSEHKRGRLHLKNLPGKIGELDFDWSDQTYSGDIWQIQWAHVFELCRMWMRGHDYLQIANTFYGARVDRLDSRSDRSPMKRAVVDIRSLQYRLAHVCGGFVMLVTRILRERGLIQTESEIPLALGMLPQGIRWGVHDLPTAFWYYNLLPTRVVAHAISDVFAVEYQSDDQIKQSVEQQSESVRRNPGLLSQINVTRDASDILAAVATLLAA